MEKYIGVDIGGTKILTLITNGQGETIASHEVKSNTETKETFFRAVTEAIDALLRKSSTNISEVNAMGVGLPGLVDSTKGMAVYQSNIPWHNFPIVARLSEHYNFINITIDNDVAMAAYNEWYQPGRTGDSLVYITVSTGIACTTIINGEVMRGHGFAGEMGHAFITHEDAYKRLEHVVSGPALERRYRKIKNNDTVTTKDLFSNYETDTDARTLIDEAAKILSVATHQVVSLIDPDTIVFGGSLMTRQPFFLELLKAYLEGLFIPDQKHILESLSITVDDGNQGALGAALRAQTIHNTIDL